MSSKCEDTLVMMANLAEAGQLNHSVTADLWDRAVSQAEAENADVEILKDGLREVVNRLVDNVDVSDLENTLSLIDGLYGLMDTMEEKQDG